MNSSSDKYRFTIKEASELGLGSERQIRYQIKNRAIQCFPPWIKGGKRQKRWILRSELVRMGVLPSTVEKTTELDALQILKMKEMERHLLDVYELIKRLQSELWLPPLHYIPARDLSIHYDAYSERTIYWTDSKDGLPVIELPVEGDSNFKCLKQHTEGSKMWQYLLEWKQLGGRYIHNRSTLLNNIKEDIQTETDLPAVMKGGKRGVLEGLSWVIFRQMFPKVRPDESKTEEFAEKAISLANKEHWNEAIEANQNIIKMFPSDADALKRLGKAQMELQRYVSAKEAYSRALEIDQCDSIAQKMLMELLQKCPDDSGIARVDGGRYRVVSKQPSSWLLAVFTDDEGENIASVCPTEIDLIITAFQNLLRKYKASSEIETILELGSKINQLKRSLSQELKAITLKTIAETRCDECPI